MSTKMEIIVDIKEIGANVFQKVGDGFAKMSKSLKSIDFSQVVGGATFLKSMTSYVDAYEEQRRATSLLSNSLKNIGMNYRDVAKEVESTTSALQSKTNFGDDEQVRALAELVPLVGSYSNAMKKLPNILDLAAFTQQDLKTASEDYAKLLQGDVPRGLGRLIPQLQEMSKAGKSAGEMMAFVEERTKGAAEADASPLIQFKNTLGDIGEDIGKIVLPSLVMLSDTFKELPNSIKMITVALPALIGLFMAIGGPATAITVAVGGIVLGLSKLYTAMKQNQELWKQDIKNMNEMANAAKGITDAVAPALAHVYNFGNNVKLASLSLEEFDRVRSQISDPAKRAEFEKAWRVANNKMTKEDIAEAKKSLTDKQKIYDATDKQNKEKLDQQWQLKSDNDAFFEQKDKEIEESNTRREARKIERKQESLEKERAIDEAKLNGAQNLASGLTAIAGLAAQKNKDFGTAYKAFAMSESIINTYRSATAALATPPVGPWNFASAAGFVLTGLANVAQIAMQKFAYGTPSAPGGLSLVGERGPELLNIPRGSQVYTNTHSKQIINNNSNPTVVVVNTDSRNIDKVLKKYTRSKSINWNRTLAMQGV